MPAIRPHDNDEPAGHNWTPAEVAYIRANARHLSDKEIAARLTEATGRVFTMWAVKEKRWRMGIVKRRGRALLWHDMDPYVPELVRVTDETVWPMHPIDAVCVATLYRGRRVRLLEKGKK